MSFGSFFRNLGKRTTDGIVGVTSGSTPMAALDSPQTYRWMAFLGIIAVGISGWLIYRNVFIATALPKQVNSGNSNTVLASSQIEALRAKDTDGDGLSDYDELYSYHTSPYLKDSDGDGISDGLELSNNSDPNCPQGKVCEGFRLLTSVVDANGNLTPEFLRKSLASAGVPQAALDKTDDASLLQIYKEVVNGQSNSNSNTSAAITNTSVTNATTNTGTAANTNTSTSTLTLTQIQNLSSDEIRQLLIQSGIDQATLQGVDDATLKKIFTEAISTNTNQ